MDIWKYVVDWIILWDNIDWNKIKIGRGNSWDMQMEHSNSSTVDSAQDRPVAISELCEAHTQGMPQ